MKICSACKESLPFSDFNKKGDGLQSKCKACNKAYYRNYYRSTSKEKERLTAKRKAAVEAARILTRKAKDVPCADCGVRYPYYVMQFDHRDPSIKDFTISRAANMYTLKKIEYEISKCDVVCANCHAQRTWG